MKLSICIANYNSGQLLSACLDSIERFSPSCAYEVIVVDNNSKDGSQEAARNRAGVTLVQNRKNTGFASANNQAFACSHGDYLLLLNADTEIQSGSLDNLLQCADVYPKAGLITAKLLNPDGTPQVGFNVRRLPNLLSAFCQLVLIDEIWPSNPVTRSHMCLDLDYDSLQFVEQPAASALLLRRAAWVEVGGFDEQFTNWYNDVDLCKRVRAGGWDILFCPSAQVMHYGGMGVASRAAQSAIVEAYRSQRLYYRKHFGRSGYAAINTMIVIGMSLRLIGLSFRPDLENRVKTHARKDSTKNALKDAFNKVLVDTIQTWSSLPEMQLGST
jgi:N-acetylglucosaminyl-diphospho-decaprenol L-rhamnosyltransferase